MDRVSVCNVARPLHLLGKLHIGARRYEFITNSTNELLASVAANVILLVILASLSSNYGSVT